MNDTYQYEKSELAQVRAQLLHLFFIVGIFSFLVNLLLLTGPLYMLHIYDRVLPSGAVQTLVALSLMACLAYAVMGVLDHTRAHHRPNSCAILDAARSAGFFARHAERPIRAAQRAASRAERSHVH